MIKWLRGLFKPQRTDLAERLLLEHQRMRFFAAIERSYGTSTMSSTEGGMKGSLTIWFNTLEDSDKAHEALCLYVDQLNKKNA